jgi:hypothetical protein
MGISIEYMVNSHFFCLYITFQGLGALHTFAPVHVVKLAREHVERLEAKRAAFNAGIIVIMSSSVANSMTSNRLSLVDCIRDIFAMAPRTHGRAMC